MTNFEDVVAFHEKFELEPIFAAEDFKVSDVDEFIAFRIRFMQEELDEFSEAVAAGDEAKMFDALLDLVYVAMGTAYSLNFPWEAGWDEVQRANMQKVRGASQRSGRWDVVKPEGWQPPNIEDVLFGDLSG